METILNFIREISTGKLALLLVAIIIVAYIFRVEISKKIENIKLQRVSNSNEKLKYNRLRFVADLIMLSALVYLILWMLSKLV